MDRETESLLILATRVLRFATDHPYAATGIFGAVVGSAVTYRAMTFTQHRPTTNGVFTPKSYQIAISTEDLRHLLNDPSTELRWETPEATVIITSEKSEPLKQLPVIEHDID